MANIKFYKMGDMPLELHKVRVVQKLHLVPINRRLDAMNEAGFNTFRLSTKDVFFVGNLNLFDSHNCLFYPFKQTGIVILIFLSGPYHNWLNYHLNQKKDNY